MNGGHENTYFHDDLIYRTILGMKLQNRGEIIEKAKAARPVVAFLGMIAAVILICREVPTVGLPLFLYSIATLTKNRHSADRYRM